MIEIVQAKNGRPVLRKNGRLLASSFDPTAEASAWAAKVCASAGPRDAIVVLGLGSGYHVLDLLARRPGARVTVIENDAALCAEVLKIHPSLAAAARGPDIVVEDDWTQLIESAKFRDAVGGVYHVAIHGPTLQMEEGYVRAVEALLRGRDRLSFLLLLKARPELVGLLDPEAIGAIGDEAMSIKTIAPLFGPHALATRERCVWRILEELVL